MRNKSKRKWSWRIAAFMVLTGLLLMTGCVSEIPVSETEQEEMQKIIVGSDRYEPYIYLDEEGKFSGIDVELATEAFHRMGYEPEFQEILWENKKDALTDGTVDCLWGCFSMNGREDEYQWAGPYLYSSQVVVVREDSEIQTVSDLTGKRIAVQETSKAEEYLLQLNNEKVPDVEMVYAFSNMDEVYAALRKGYVDAICGHESALNVLVESAPAQYRILKENLFAVRLGVAFDKTYDPEFVRELDQILKDMMVDGTTARIVERYGLDVEKALDGGD
ncbi:amino acid ABC transporter substrate-binding protein [Dorea sp. OM02-2LB]|nr:amino acid ABC transporter substrate-binding protein [Dorea sp. OM02-2LB]